MAEKIVAPCPPKGDPRRSQFLLTLDSDRGKRCDPFRSERGFSGNYAFSQRSAGMGYSLCLPLILLQVIMTIPTQAIIVVLLILFSNILIGIIVFGAGNIEALSLVNLFREPACSSPVPRAIRSSCVISASFISLWEHRCKPL